MSVYVTRAWSCTVRLVVADRRALPAAAAELTSMLGLVDTIASRFRSSSALCRANANAGRPTPVPALLEAAGAATPQAVVIGGYHGTWHAPIGEIALSRAGLSYAGGTFGAGVLLVLDDTTCALGELARVADWLAGESANQCGPCRFGLPALARDVGALFYGSAAAGGSAFGHARVVAGRGACRHPDGAARFVTSGLHLLQDEVAWHLRGGCGRPVRGLLPIGGER